jgi:hypothetical protein
MHEPEKGPFERLPSKMNHGTNNVLKAISDRETRLLNAFYDFAQSNQKLHDGA